MRIALIIPKYQSLAMECLSSSLRKVGHQTELFYDPQLFGNCLGLSKPLTKITSFKGRLVAKVKRYTPNLVCIPIVSDNYFWAKQLAKEIKSKFDVKIAVGGIHPTSVPERVIENEDIDFLCIGEGEKSIIDIVKSTQGMRTGIKIKNVWYKKSGKVIKGRLRRVVDDLDKLPFPDKDVTYRNYPFLLKEYFITASRGCVFNCSFCSNNTLKKVYLGKYPLRIRSVRNVIGELKIAKHKYKPKAIIFYDDVFPTYPAWLKEFSSRYKTEIGLPFFCSMHPQFVNDNVVALLKEAGCSTINLGIQSLNGENRRKYYHRSETNRKITEAIRVIKRHKIFLRAEIILGFPPNQSEDELLDYVRFLNKNRVDSVHTYWLTYLPKTRIVDIAVKEGFLKKGDVSWINDAALPAPFHVKGHTFNIRCAKIANLMILTTILNKSMINFIIKNKRYIIIPYVDLYKFNRLVKIMISKLKGETPLPRHFFSLWQSYNLLINKIKK